MFDVFILVQFSISRLPKCVSSVHGSIIRDWSYDCPPEVHTVARALHDVVGLVSIVSMGPSFRRPSSLLTNSVNEHGKRNAQSVRIAIGGGDRWLMEKSVEYTETNR